MRVRRGSSYGVVGRWVAYDATETQKFTVTVGLSRTDTSTSLMDVKDTLTIGASLSASVEEIVSEESVTVDVQNEFMIDFQQSLSKTMLF